MKLIKEIWDKDIDPTRENPNEEDLEIRETVRIVLINKLDQVGILELSKVNAHDLPGGGIDLGENHEKAAKRELLEETGYECEIIGEIGYVLEFKNEYKVKQFSYGYIARVLGEKNNIKLTDNEIYLGMNELEWHEIDEAIRIFENDKPDIHDIKHLVQRDLLILIEAKKCFTEIFCQCK